MSKPLPFSDHYWMEKALREAVRSEKEGEIPVGAIAVLGNKLVSRGHNRSIVSSDPMAHAEIVCLRRAAKRLKNYRLTDIILYVTLEPCLMCAGAIVWSRVKRVVFGCRDVRPGAAGLDLARGKKFNHCFEVTGGVLEEECRSILQGFFKKKRYRSPGNA